tara:strand:+ start:285 stop:1919 length:1635 start_codon:yes stop_codon:yes gene_type:complete
MTLLDRLRSDRTPQVDLEVARILALPRKGTRPDGDDLAQIQADLGGPGCTMPLLLVQAKALYWIRQQRGLAGIIGVGHGKCLISLLAATALGAKRPLLLVPARLRKQTQEQLVLWAEQYRIVPPVVASYADLSTDPKLLDTVAPDLIVADECHKLRHRGAARTRRVLRYFRQNPDTRFVGLSGTYTSKSLRDYAHLMELALRHASPLPLEYPQVEAWASMVDVDGDPNPYDAALFQPVVHATGAATPRAALFHLLDHTPGVELTKGQACGASIEIRAIELPAPKAVTDLVDKLETDWETPGGEALMTALRVAAVRRQLLQGFYYEWDWPDGVKDLDWLDARAAWSKAVRSVINTNRRGLDTPAQVYEAVADGSLTRLDVVDAWSAWLKHEATPAPPVRTEWVSSYLLDATAALLARTGPALVWANSRALLSGLSVSMPSVPPGHDPPSYLPQLALSIPSHGVGLNLQAWHTNILTSVPPGGATVEQLLGRTHRQGQEADEVTVYYFRTHASVENDWRKVRADAEYVQASTGQAQKVLAASLIRD